MKTTTDSAVQQSATESGGVLANYRYFFTDNNGVEASYGYSLNTQTYGLASRPLGVKAHQVSPNDADYEGMRRQFEQEGKVNTSADARLGRMLLAVPRAVYRIADLARQSILYPTGNSVCEGAGVRAQLSVRFAVVFLAACLCARTSELALVLLSSTDSNAGSAPTGWQIKTNHGKPAISTCIDDETACVHLKSVKSSFGLERAVDIDPAEMPYLSWRWKVSQLPAGGDFRRAASDDQAAQVLVVFADRRVLTYIWDTTAPKGTMASASSIPLLHVFAVVCQSGAVDLNRWITESRNVAADYERAYQKPAPHVKGIRLQVNSQHTGSIAESYFGEVEFHSSSR